MVDLTDKKEEVWALNWDSFDRKALPACCLQPNDAPWNSSPAAQLNCQWRSFTYQLHCYTAATAQTATGGTYLFMLWKAKQPHHEIPYSMAYTFTNFGVCSDLYFQEYTCPGTGLLIRSCVACSCMHAMALLGSPYSEGLFFYVFNANVLDYASIICFLVILLVRVWLCIYLIWFFKGFLILPFPKVILFC